MKEEGERIDQRSQQNAKELMESLSSALSNFMKWVGGEVDEWAKVVPKLRGGINTSDGTKVRFGGDPSRDPIIRGRDKLSVLRANLNEKERIYFSRDPNGKAELILPKVPPKYLPEMLSYVSGVLKAGKAQGNLTFDYKAAGMDYVPVPMDRQQQFSIGNLPQPDELNKVLKLIEDALKILVGLRAKGEMEAESKSKQSIKVGNFLEVLGKSATRLWKYVSRGLKQTSPENVRVARELYTLATKLDDPNRPGQLRGHNFSIVTQGPGRVSLFNSSNGKEVFSISQKDPWAHPEIKVTKDVTPEEVNAISSRIAYINKAMGDRGMTQFVSETAAVDLARILEGFTPPEILAGVLSFQSQKATPQVPENQNQELPPVAEAAESEKSDGLELA